ncbi:MAG TPA: energy transducer TonB [Blastocatellia bacterium]|nr:energy transducer TonB [Blastocatellia bacterium]
MKRLLFTSVFAFMFICPVAAQEPRSREIDEVVGPVQTVRLIKAGLSKKADKVEEGPRVVVSVSTYDQMRNLVESSINKPDGSVFKKYAARYAASGNVEESYSNSKGSMEAKFVTSYDQAAKKAETIGYNSKGAAISKTVYAFDNTGRIAEEIRYDKSGRVNNKTVCTYDEGKQERKFYDGESRIQYSAVTTLNPQGKPAEEKYYRPDGSVIVRVHRAYDNQGNCNDEVYDLGAGGLHWRYDYEYDSRGNWTKRRTFKQILNAGLPEYEPIEVMYRAINYVQSPDDNPSELERSRIQATSGLLLGEAVERKPPFNPGRTVGTGVAGQIAALVMIDEQGSVLFTRWLSGFDKFLNDAAETVTNNWKYTPTLKGGRFVTVISTITFDYKPDFR